MLYFELQGLTDPPDKLVDAILFHQWFDANRCPDCNGSGRYRPKSDHPVEIWRAREGCATCRGTGTAPHLFDPDF